jgi:O-antigen/teichoic acid export membrane protein
MAAAWATLFAYGSMTVISYFIGKKYYPIKYPIKKMSFYILASIGICSLSFLQFRGDFLISTGLLLLFAAIIFWNERKDIKLFLK